MIRLSAFADEASSSFEGQVAALKRNQISYIEVRGLDGVNVLKLTEEAAREYAARFAEEGIRVWSIGSPIGKVEIGCDFEAYKEDVRHICRIAKIFDTDKIRVFSFFEAYDAEEKVFEYLREMVKIADEYGVCLYHENEKKIYGDTVDRVLRIRENVEGLKFVYDPANYLEVGTDMKRAMELLVDKTDYFHIKDLIAETGARTPAGYGSGMIDELVRRIGDADCVMTLEPHLKLFKGYAEIDGAEMTSQFRYANSDEAFDAAVEGLKKVLAEQGYGYNEQAGGYERV